jgi:hypothetical protein
LRFKALRKKSRQLTVEDEPEDVQAIKAAQENLAVKENPSRRSPSPALYESIFTKGTSKTEAPRKMVTSNPSILIFIDETTHKNDSNMFPPPCCDEDTSQDSRLWRRLAVAVKKAALLLD